MAHLRFAILTSGGDASGMNAALRGVVREAHAQGHVVMGVQRGFCGLIQGALNPLGPRDVSNILQHGGTFLRTSRCPEFATEEGRRKAVDTLRAHAVDVLIVVGGNGSLRGAMALAGLWGGQVLGLPGTIDNDLYGTDETIGYDTAVTTALDAIDKIRDTADSHERFFLVEVMGRDAGFIALQVALGGGAEEVLVPEETPDFPAMVARLRKGRQNGKTSSIVIVAEGAYPGGAQAVATELHKLGGDDYRVTVLGHIQRGGAPTARERLLATRLGAHAVRAAIAGETGKMVGLAGNRLTLVPLADAVNKKKSLDPELLALARRLSQ
ncbi:MAG TPA: 6-phosphofructokinase [Fibrobacteria bacterium]|nr:6-phosphofructokinase [Fibrobacteria bacterium]